MRATIVMSLMITAMTAQAASLREARAESAEAAPFTNAEAGQVQPFTGGMRAQDGMQEMTQALPGEAAAARPAITDEAQRVYQAYGDAIYQVQVIDIASGKKAAIGSGFQFSEDGLLATNYHVVSEAIRKPANNRLEFLHEKGARGGLTILMADVVNDLAILRMEKPGERHVALGTSKLAKGTRLFALGNPHDIGFTIVEGIYNGPARDSFIDRIHFSGAINQGMSGGPALGHDGRVAGINVMTGGNQIGFLVPVEPLQKLLDGWREKGADFDFTARADDVIEAQLTARQAETMSLLLAGGKPWEPLPFGPVLVPGRIHDALKCWGGIAHEEKDPYRHFSSACYNQDTIFLADGFETGLYSYRYDYISANDDLALPRFYNLYEEKYAQMAEMSNAGEEDVTNFVCNDGFTDVAGLRWKTSFCTRGYKRYAGLYDAHLYMALVGQGRTGMLVSATAMGVTQDNALAFTRRFIEALQPKPQEMTEVALPQHQDDAPATQDATPARVQEAPATEPTNDKAALPQDDSSALPRKGDQP